MGVENTVRVMGKEIQSSESICKMWYKMQYSKHKKWRAEENGAGR